ncbi:MAG: DegT/DnrJ/EryC1/StrS aminotransferase [Bacteroidota bacterium]|jgi:dTDP-4-amino-4,6-dideoxygalactose transaminase
MNVELTYQARIAQYLHIAPEQVSLYWKGRVALYTVLKAMGVGPGDEVVLPAFTCVVVPNAILYLGATPIYVDINPTVLCCSAEQIEQVITPKTKVILIQNMLGLSFEVEEIVSLAKARGIYTIEDCTHGFGGKHQDVFNGLRSDASFFSSQWNKPFSTGIGGMLVVNNRDLLQPVNQLNSHLIKPSAKDQFILFILIWARTYLLKGFTYWTFLRLYRWLSKKGVVVGSSSASELEGINMPKDYFKGMSSVQCRAGIKALSTFDQVISQRKNSGVSVHQWLTSQGKTTVPSEHMAQHAFLKYPILVKDRALFLQQAEKEKVPLGDWFISPLHPVLDSLEPWGLEVSNFPNAVYVSKHIVNLPLDIPVHRLINFLELYKNEII